MFEQLFEESPIVQRIRKQSEEEGIEKGREEGIEEGAIQNSQRTLVRFVQARFPELTEFAQKQVKLCNRLDMLETITEQLFTAPDSRTAQQLLGSMSEQQV